MIEGKKTQRHSETFLFIRDIHHLAICLYFNQHNIWLLYWLTFHLTWTFWTVMIYLLLSSALCIMYNLCHLTCSIMYLCIACIIFYIDWLHHAMLFFCRNFWKYYFSSNMYFSLDFLVMDLPLVSMLVIFLVTTL